MACYFQVKHFDYVFHFDLKEFASSFILISKTLLRLLYYVSFLESSLGKSLGNLLENSVKEECKFDKLQV